MGLDMNLYRSDKVTFPITINNKNELCELNFKTYNRELTYWRYGTPVHQFFEDKLGRPIKNCEYVLIHRDWLRELYEKCKDILNKCVIIKKTGLMNDVEYCKKILPTSNKFNEAFCRYDEWYYNCLYETQFKIDKALTETNFDYEDVYYEADW